jgi:NTP pyrophosphatase (non-canonical NTP hydrolase)
MYELEKIPELAEALHQRFGGREPYQMITHLLEECGELAQEVSHFEGSETKLAKHGAPSKEKFAKEVLDVLRLVFQIVEHYKLEPMLRAKINSTYDNCFEQGLFDDLLGDGKPRVNPKYAYLIRNSKPMTMEHLTSTTYSPTPEERIADDKYFAELDEEKQVIRDALEKLYQSRLKMENT